MRGTTPAGARTEQDAAQWVRAMFGRLARRYDLANHLLSFNIDRHWRRRTVRRVGEVLRRPERLCLTSAAAPATWFLRSKRERGGAVWGSDFCHPMLVAAREKIAGRNGRSTCSRPTRSPCRCATHRSI